METKNVVKSIETIIGGLNSLKEAILERTVICNGATPVDEVVEKSANKKAAKNDVEDTKSKKTKKATKAAETEEESGDENYASMKYNELKKLAVERGMKTPNVSKAEIIAFLTGEVVDSDDEDEVENEAVENDTEEEDLTAKVTEMLEDVETEDLAEFLADNGISAKGKRPSLIAKLVAAIEDGDISLDDLFEDEDGDDNDTEEEEPAPKKKSTEKKSAKSKKKAEPVEDEPEDEEEETSDVDGYVEDEDGNFVNEDEEDEILATITVDRYKAYEDYMAKTKKAIKKASEKKAIIADLKEFFGDEFNAKEDDILECAGRKFLYMTDDDGETHEMEEPYEINGIACCCGQELDETDDGYVCGICETEYSDEEE